MVMDYHEEHPIPCIFELFFVIFQPPVSLSVLSIPTGSTYDIYIYICVCVPLCTYIWYHLVDFNGTWRWIYAIPMDPPWDSPNYMRCIWCWLWRPPSQESPSIFPMNHQATGRSQGPTTWMLQSIQSWTTRAWHSGPTPASGHNELLDLWNKNLLASLVGLLGGGFKHFFFHPEIWGRFPFWLYNIFQMGWNRQLEDLLSLERVFSAKCNPPKVFCLLERDLIFAPVRKERNCNIDSARWFWRECLPLHAAARVWHIEFYRGYVTVIQSQIALPSEDGDEMWRVIDYHSVLRYCNIYQVLFSKIFVFFNPETWGKDPIFTSMCFKWLLEKPNKTSFS